MAEKILIGLSGGVDSSVAAFLLQRSGADCLGAMMKLYPKAAFEAEADARAVADRLGIPFRVLELQEAFRTEVIEDFRRVYESGATPIPCIVCNKKLKFGRMLEAAQTLGCDAIATGHYARIRQDPVTSRYLLYKALDTAKDQSYFLAGLSQRQLAHTRFPLGTLTKEQARAIAREQGLVTARKRDSQDICFVPDGDYAAFLEEYTDCSFPAGDYLDPEGRVVGRHQGAIRYTVGQRKGLNLALGRPVYVVRKDMAANTVTVGDNADLFSPALLADSWNWIPFDRPEQPLTVTARIRHSHSEVPATVYPEDGGLARVVFEAPQRAVSPGQAVVLYQDDLVVGCGTITKAL